MIKRQYGRFNHGYFYNFINSQSNMEMTIEDGLAPYQATLGKSKNKHSLMNVKWHDAQLYTLFVLKWS